MVFALAFADDLFAGTRPHAGPAPASLEGDGFLTRLEAAAGSFVAMVQRWL